MAFGGLAVAVFDRTEDGPVVDAGRVLFACMGIAGVVAGYYSRGAILGVASPLLGVGLAWTISWAAGRKAGDRFGDAFGAIAVAVGVFALFRGYKVLYAAEPNTKDLSMAVGAMLKPQGKYPTYDFFIGHLGHALAPWSALVPFAFGRMFMAPEGRQGWIAQRESYLRAALLVGAACSLSAHALLAPKTDLIPFTGIALMAVACAVALRDYDRGAAPSIAMAVGVVLFAAVFHHDFHELPEKAFQAFGVVGAVFPESFKDTALLLWWAALGGFAVFAFLTFVERDPEREPFDPKRYLHVMRSLREAWDGMLALAYFAMVAGSSIAGLVIYLGARSHAAWVAQISIQIRDGILNAWWITAIAPFAAVFGIYFMCDVWLWAFDRSRPLSKQSLSRGFEPFENLIDRMKEGKFKSPDALAAEVFIAPLMMIALPAAIFFTVWKGGSRWLLALSLALPSSIVAFLVLGILGDLFHKRGGRVSAFAVGSAAVGLVMCFQYYPALANQLSPKEVFESYEKCHKQGEPLALFGVGGRTAAYYAGGQPESFNDPQSAFQWLMAGGSTTHYMAVRADELPRLNQLYRQRSMQMGQKAENLPVLDARSSQIILVGSSLVCATKNQSPLDKIILTEPPKPQRPLNANMEDKLLVLGIDLTDANGKLIDALRPGAKFHMRIYYKVLAPVTTEWEGFIHIDGFHRRHNGDHKVMNGKYPFSLWQKDDLLVDDVEMTLEPNFSPGQYTIYFGLFLGETRLKVTSGPSDGENRIVGGAIRVQ